MPYYKDVKKANCPFPPKKQLILDEANKEASKKPNPARYNLGFVDAAYVDKPWLLDILCTLNENHEFFKKGYRPEKAEVVKQPDDDEFLDFMHITDPHGFFKDLPNDPNKKGLKRKGRNLFMNKCQREQVKAKHLEVKALKAKKAYERLMQKSA